MPATAPPPKGNRTLGPGTVFSQCNGSYNTGDDQKFDTTGEVFNPKTGHVVPLPVPTVPAGQKLVGQACTVGGDEDHIRVFYVMTLSKPSDGLTPEDQTTSIVAFDPFSSAPPQTAAWPEGAKVDRILPTYHGFLARAGFDNLVGFDGGTLQPTFTSTDRLGNINFAGFFTYGTGGQGHEVFHSTKDGAVVGENTGVGMGGGAEVFPAGMIVIVGNDFPYKYGYFDFRDNLMKTPTARSGTMWGDTLTSWGGKYIEVRDLAQNKLLFERAGDDVEGLHIKNLYFAGKYLYIENDSDSPVIDITNSQKVSSGWVVRPTDRVGRDWMLVVKGHVTNDYTSCFGQDAGQYRCYEDGTLVYAPNGNYAGPWF